MPTSPKDSDFAEIIRKTQEKAKESYKNNRHDYLLYGQDPSNYKKLNG